MPSAFYSWRHRANSFVHLEYFYDHFLLRWSWFVADLEDKKPLMQFYLVIILKCESAWLSQQSEHSPALLSVNTMHSCVAAHGHLWSSGEESGLCPHLTHTTRQPRGLFGNLFKGTAGAEPGGHKDKTRAKREACINSIFADYIASRYDEFNPFSVANCITMAAHRGSQLRDKLSLSSLWV